MPSVHGPSACTNSQHVLVVVRSGALGAIPALASVSMDASGASTSVEAARWAFAVAALLAGLSVAVVTASGFAYDSLQGPARLREAAGPLGVSVVVGVVTLAAVRATLRRPLRSPWLLVGVLPAAFFAFHHLGGISG